MASRRNILHFHKSCFISLPPPALNRWLWKAPSLINDQWRTVRLRNERHITIPLLILHRGSEWNTSCNVPSKPVQRRSTFPLFLFVSKRSAATCWKVDFQRDGGNSQGQPAVGGCRVFYIVLWNSGLFFFLMFTSSNNIFTVKGRVPEENYPPISKPLFRGAGGLWSLSQHALDKKQE